MNAETAARQNFTVSLSASNEGRGSAQPTISIGIKLTSVGLKDIPKATDIFNEVLKVATEIQETSPSRA